MAEPFIGEIRPFSFGYPPKDWAICAGQLLSINQNQALFSLLGTTYGGNGVNTFGLPDLRGRVPVHPGNGVIQGQVGGEEAHTLTLAEMAAHNHIPVAGNGGTALGTPEGNTWGTIDNVNLYDTTANGGTLDPSAIAAAGSSQGHNNMQPYLVMNYCIALVGIFPSRN